MSSISGINNSLASSYSHLSSGKRVNTAADGAAEMAIIQKEDSQVRGLDAGSRNVGSAKDAINISDGALSNVADSLQRMRELAVQASNTATMTDTERSSIQKEIDQLKQGISDIANNTNYNTKNLLDGSNPTLNLATDSNGNSVSFNTSNATLKELGIEDFDVTGDFDIQAIDDALAKVNSDRSSLGAQSNGFDYISAYNSHASYNTTAAKSKLEDLDYPQAVSEKKKQQTMQQYALMMQKKKQESEANKINNLF